LEIAELGIEARNSENRNLVAVELNFLIEAKECIFYLNILVGRVIYLFWCWAWPSYFIKEKEGRKKKNKTKKQRKN